VNNNLFAGFLNFNSHFSKAVNCGKTVCPLKKIGYLGITLGEGSQHDGPVRDGFVTGDVQFTAKRLCKF
jgi:hypothetical protein